VRLNVNGAEVEVDDRHDQSPLLWVLRFGGTFQITGNSRSERALR